jgi:hypothetical protein
VSLYAPNPPPIGFSDACTSTSESTLTQFTGFKKIAEAKLRDYFAGATCGMEWMGEIVTSPCQQILGDTYTYCVQLNGLPNDPNITPVRKPTPLDGHPFFDGYVGVQGTTEFDVEMPGPGYGPVAVSNVEFAYCSADPMLYNLVYKWKGDTEGQILEAGEGLPTDTVTAEFRDQNWYDWRSSIGEGGLQEGRVESLPAFSSGTPANLVTPTVQVSGGEWVATSPDRVRAIAKVSGAWRLYNGATSSALTVPEPVATLLTNYPKSINWHSTDELLVVASDGTEFKSAAATVKVHRIKISGPSLSQVGSPVDVNVVSLGNAAVEIYAISAIG